MIFDAGLFHTYNNLFGLQYLYGFLYRKIIVFDAITGVVINYEASTPLSNGFEIKESDVCIYSGFPATRYIYAYGAIRQIFTGDEVININIGDASKNYLLHKGIDYLIFSDSTRTYWYKSTNRLASSQALPPIFFGKSIESIANDYALFCAADGGRDIYTDTGTLISNVLHDGINTNFKGFTQSNYCWSGENLLKHTLNGTTTNYAIDGLVRDVYFRNNELIVVSQTIDEVVVSTCFNGTVTENLRIDSDGSCISEIYEPRLFVFTDKKIHVINIESMIVEKVIDLTTYLIAATNKDIEKFISIF